LLIKSQTSENSLLETLTILSLLIVCFMMGNCEEKSFLH
jgi:hypothetical protein